MLKNMHRPFQQGTLYNIDILYKCVLSNANAVITGTNLPSVKNNLITEI